MSEISVSVIIPVFNQSRLTVQQITMIKTRYRHRQDIEWIIVDNGSTDDTPRLVEIAQDGFPRLRYVRNEENTGFGPANNQGAGMAEGDTLIFLSNDVLVMGDFVTDIQLALMKDSTALVGAQLVDFPSGWNTFEELDKPISYLAGWCLGMKKSTFGAVGRFDPRYKFCDYEDMDLSYSWEQAGWPLVCIRLPLRHLSGQTAQHMKGGRLAITLANQQRFCEKWGLTIKQQAEAV